MNYRSTCRNNRIGISFLFLCHVCVGANDAFASKQALSCNSDWIPDNKLQIDVNNDGEITIPEAVRDPNLLASFHLLDRDKNKRLTEYELNYCRALSSTQAKKNNNLKGQ